MLYNLFSIQAIHNLKSSSLIMSFAIVKADNLNRDEELETLIGGLAQQPISIMDVFALDN